jgi:hypothetical protein
VIRVNGKLRSADGAFPHFIPLDSNGAVIPQSRDEISHRLLRSLPTRAVPHPAMPSPGTCEIDVKGHPMGLTANGGSVISEVHGFTGIAGSGFITCASTSYELSGWPLLASILISASHPGAAPPSLPGMKSVPGYPGIFSAPGPERAGSEGELYARRVRGAWLVVGRAKSAQRLALLKDLRVTVRIGS